VDEVLWGSKTDGLKTKGVLFQAPVLITCKVVGCPSRSAVAGLEAADVAPATSIGAPCPKDADGKVLGTFLED